MFFIHPLPSHHCGPNYTSRTAPSVLELQNAHSLQLIHPTPWPRARARKHTHTHLLTGSSKAPCSSGLCLTQDPGQRSSAAAPDGSWSRSRVTQKNTPQKEKIMGKGVSSFTSSSPPKIRQNNAPRVLFWRRISWYSIKIVKLKPDGTNVLSLCVGDTRPHPFLPLSLYTIDRIDDVMLRHAEMPGLS